jgi:hypothetical protein
MAALSQLMMAPASAAVARFCAHMSPSYRRLMHLHIEIVSTRFGRDINTAPGDIINANQSWVHQSWVVM